MAAYNAAPMNPRLLLVLLLLCCSAACQTDAERVMNEALKPSNLEHDLMTLTDMIGGRVPGTPAMERALQFSLTSLKSADSARLEPFQIPVSWSEGDTRVEMTEPTQFRLRAVSIAWAPPLKQTTISKVVDVGDGDAASFARAGDISGALVLVHSEVLKNWDDLFGEYLRAPAIINAAVKGHALAIAWTATREHDILYRHINTLNGTIDRIPQVLLAREDALRLARLLTHSKLPVKMSVSIPNRIGPAIQTANVVAELRGSELPNEFVVLGAHLDSWELGTGALDDGCNAALVIDTMRAIKASGVKLRRSIRFVLFSGEEQGTLGSWAYVKQHRNELGNAVAAVLFDEGTGTVTGFSLGGRKDAVNSIATLIAPLAQWKATQLTTDAFIGTDNFDFLLEGVPTLVANQVEANYLPNYHATSDTFDKVDIPELKKHVAIAAEVVTALANAPQRPAPRQSRAEIEQLVRETHLDDQMKTFSLWADWEAGTRGRSK